MVSLRSGLNTIVDPPDPPHVPSSNTSPSNIQNNQQSTSNNLPSQTNQQTIADHQQNSNTPSPQLQPPIIGACKDCYRLGPVGLPCDKCNRPGFILTAINPAPSATLSPSFAYQQDDMGYCPICDGQGRVGLHCTDCIDSGAVYESLLPTSPTSNAQYAQPQHNSVTSILLIQPPCALYAHTRTVSLSHFLPIHFSLVAHNRLTT